MSGGYWNYADESLKYEIFGWTDEYNEAPNVFEDPEINELIWDVFELLHEYDYYREADNSRETYMKSVSDFKAKWFGDHDARIKRLVKVVDREMEILRTTVHEAFEEFVKGADR